MSDDIGGAFFALAVLVVSIHRKTSTTKPHIWGEQTPKQKKILNRANIPKKALAMRWVCVVCIPIVGPRNGWDWVIGASQTS